MAKSKKIVLSVFTLIVLLWLSPKVAAAPRPLTDLGYFRWANQITTPADNTFIMHYGEHTSVEPIEGKVTGKIVTVDWSTSKSSALIKNVGFYKGQEVNLKVTLERNKSNLDGGSIFFTEGNFLSIDISGEMIITYDFLDTSGNPLTIETSFNYYGLNVNKYVGYRNPSRVIKYLCTNNPTNIVYDVYGDGDRQWGDYWGYYKNITPNVPWRDPRQSFEVITNPVSQLHVVVHNNDSTPSSVIYRTDFLAKPEFPSSYATDSFFEKADQDVCLKAKQTIPNISQWKKANQLQVRFGLEQIAKTQQYKAKKVKVTNFSGEDITELFSSKVEGQEMVITAKNPEDHRLYDTVLQYEVELEWTGKENVVETSAIINDRLPLPFKVKTILNGQETAENTGTSLVNYLGEVHIQFLDEQDRSLSQEVIKTGILTTNYDLSKDYPEISGFFPIKNEETDHGRFQLETQTIIHRYRKGEPLRFELLNKENPLMVSRFSKSCTIKFTFSHEGDSTIYLMAKCNEEEKRLQTYSHVPEKVEDEIKTAFPENWIGKEVSFYVMTDDKEQSPPDRRKLAVEKGPQLLLPKSIDFGEQEIPANDTFVAAVNQREIQVEDSSHLEQSKWIIKVREEKPLINDKSKQLCPLFFTIQGKTIELTGSDQQIWQGTGKASFGQIGNIQLKLRPSDEVGDYEGTLVWTMEDVPI
ncbi:hypothetical protein [Enterococcus faecium]|uniref:hypothetical protein n=1 Tax=Enterococcus faecium TaxID=1352 RepID=UPI000BF0C353|nr:hypothetical protein [Enterococcus faecium]PEH47966.1 hypothetical protein CRM75_08665 [Enterococcus faecium]